MSAIYSSRVLVTLMFSERWNKLKVTEMLANVVVHNRNINNVVLINSNVFTRNVSQMHLIFTESKVLK